MSYQNPHQQPHQQPYPNTYRGGGTPGQSDNGIAMLIHLSAILTYFIGPLIFYFIYKDDHRGTLREHSRRALNFNLLACVVSIAVTIVTTVLAFITFGLLGFLVSLAGLVWVAVIVFAIIAAIKAHTGEVYEYPVTVNWVK